MRSIVLEIDWATFRGCATSHDDSWWILDLYKRLFEMDLSKNGGTANMVMLMGTEFSGNVLSSSEKEKTGYLIGNIWQTGTPKIYMMGFKPLLLGW